MKALHTGLLATFLAAAVSTSTAFAEPPADGAKGDRAHKMHAHLKAADKDGDSKISRDEANASMPRMAKNFDAIDANKDGFVTKEEMRALREKNGGAKGDRGHKMHAHLKAADKDGDGKISREEANASMPRLAKNFEAIDANKDGFVTKEEMGAFREKNGGRMGKQQS